MSNGISVWMVILAALVAANLPFLNERAFLLVALSSGVKSLWVRLGELVVLYLGVGVFGRLLEQSAGQVAPQGWEFYAITGCLFLTFAFPGFVYRYLGRRHAL